MSEELTFLGKIWFSVFRPKEFFDYIEEENKAYSSMLYFALLLTLTLPLHFVIIGFIGNDFSLSVFIELLSNLIIGAIFTLILLPFYHLFVYIFGGRNGIKRSVQILLYGATPTIAVSWIPIVPLLVVFYSIYVTVIGLKKLHEMSTMRAVLAYIIPFLILVTLVILSMTIGYISI
ncbi:MAG: YIP1 family protein [Candidatus Aenigmarchaeota archaeon]|nr:YIP1 family protein [Candidatus Aenigmarchaeota archaeon]